MEFGGLPALVFDFVAVDIVFPFVKRRPQQQSGLATVEVLPGSACINCWGNGGQAGTNHTKTNEQSSIRKRMNPPGDLVFCMKPIDDTLRRAILDCGISACELARRTGVPQPTITRFLAGADLRMSNGAKIAAYLGLTLKKS